MKAENIYSKQTMRLVDDGGLLMRCLVCGKEHNAIRDEHGLIKRGSYYCRFGCKITQPINKL